MYYPGLAPRGGNLDDLGFYVQSELEQLSAILQTMLTQQVHFAELHVEPARPRDGMIVFADGTNWNPGGGRALYLYKDATAEWIKLFDMGANTNWLDLDFPVILKTTGPGNPTVATIQGNITGLRWAVNDAQVLEPTELIHAWKEGSEFQWHAHFLSNGVDTTDRYVRWEVEWFWANRNGQISSTITTTSNDILIPANTPDKTMFAEQIGLHTLSSAHIGGHIWARLRRVASVGAAPTNDPFCSMVQIHIECDSIGSRSRFAK